MNLRSAIPIVVLATIAIVAVLAVRSMSAGAPASCAPLAEGAILESRNFAPPDEIERPPEVPINPTPSVGPELPPDPWIPTDTLDDLPLQLAREGTPGEVVRWFSDRAIDPTLTLSGFIAQGGVVFSRSPLSGATASGLLESLGERAVAVEVGLYDGVLTWADPLVNGVRPHQLWWSDDQYAYYLLADRSAVAITNLGRGMVCG